MSQRRASEFMNVARSEGIVGPAQYCWRLPLNGQLQNKDTLVGEGGLLPEVRELNQVRGNRRTRRCKRRAARAVKRYGGGEKPVAT